MPTTNTMPAQTLPTDIFVYILANTVQQKAASPWTAEPGKDFRFWFHHVSEDGSFSKRTAETF